MSDNNGIVDEKIARVRAAISLEAHDRVPVIGTSSFWPVNHTKKCTMQEAFYSMDAAADCYKEAFSEFNGWDAFNALIYSFGPALDATGSRRYSVPGRDISPHAEFQHPDLTLMDSTEYARLIDDPVRFHVEEVIPRLCKNIASDDPLVRAKAWSKAALFYEQSMQKARGYSALWRNEYGIPPLFQGQSIYVPIDWLADKVRGFHQGLLDIKERPEEVSAACEAMLPFILNASLSSASAGGDYPLIFNPQHVSPFISPRDYEKVYWPTFKKMVDHVVGRGYRVWVYFEHNQEQHLERLQDLPQGKIVAQLEDTDLAKAKKALGGKICIAGGMPAILLARGTPQQVREQTISVLRLFQDDPGFIMACGIPHTARPENIHAWLDAAREYGRLGSATPPMGKVEPARGTGVANDVAGGPDVFTRWETVRSEFGKIKGDESVIKGKWEDLEKANLSFLYWLMR